MSRACAALSDLNFSSDDSSSSDEDKKVKRKPDDFTGFCLMAKSSRNIFDSDFDVSDDLSPESLSLRVVELESALCNKDKLPCMVFHKNKKLNLELLVCLIVQSWKSDSSKLVPRCLVLALVALCLYLI
jgi:hypothetical protein